MPACLLRVTWSYLLFTAQEILSSLVFQHCYCSVLIGCPSVFYSLWSGAIRKLLISPEDAQSFSPFFFLLFWNQNTKMTLESFLFFYPAALLITVPPVETQAERIKSELLRPALWLLLFDLPLWGDVSAVRKMDVCLPLAGRLICSLHVAHPTPSQAADPLTVSHVDWWFTQQPSWNALRAI